MPTKIEWTDETWNPVTGCTKVSEGCDHCYAETIAHRFTGTKAYPNGFDVTLRPERLDQPLRWKRPRKVFVNSMSDLFHPAVTDEHIAQVFAVMALAPQHTFQVLTKRPGRMRSLLSSEQFESAVFLACQGEFEGYFPWPLPNVWLGTSVENQKWADVRIPLLLDTPAAIRFLSCEPLLGPVDLCRYLAVGSVQLGKNFTGQVALDDEQAVERTEHCLNIPDTGNLPRADRLPTVPNRAVAVPADSPAPHGHREPVDQLSGGAVDRHDGRVLPVRPAAPLDVSLPVEKPRDIAESSRIGGHLDAGWAEPLTSPADSAGGNHASSNGLAGDIEALGDLRDGESGQVGADDVGGSRTSVGHDLYDTRTPGIHWIICGGESGPHARPMHPDWARQLRDDCLTAGIPFHFKQWGEWVTEDQAPEDIILPGLSTYLLGDDEPDFYKVGKKAAGREIDGQTWDEYPGGLTDG